MNYYYITGVSRGIGKALVEKLLEVEDNYVIGFGRTNNISHERYEFIQIDLTNLDLLQNYNFIDIVDAKSICLINNSGMLGDVNKVGKIDNSSIIQTFNLNVIAPALLMNNFVKAYQNFKGEKLVLNISSGAGRHTIESWSSYCGSKAALDMFTAVANDEQKNEFLPNPIKFIAVAPGIVDTKMQDEIRKLDENKFKDINKFVNYKKNNLLSSPEEVAEKLIKIIRNPSEKCLIDVRED